MIAGLESGVDASRFSLALAYYLHKKERQKVLVLELGEEELISYLAEEKNAKRKGKYYEWEGLTFQYCSQYEEVCDILLNSTSLVCVNIVKWNSNMREVMRLCQRKIFFVNMKPWKRNLLGEFIKTQRKDKQDIEQMEIVCWNLLKEEKVWFQKNIGGTIYGITWIDQYRQLEEHQKKQLQEFIYLS